MRKIELELKRSTLWLPFFRKHCRLFPHQKRMEIFIYIFAEAWIMFIEKIKMGKIKDTGYFGFIETTKYQGMLFTCKNYPVMVFTRNHSLNIQAEGDDKWAGEYSNFVGLYEIELPDEILSSDLGIIVFEKTFSTFLKTLDWEKVIIKARKKILLNHNGHKGKISHTHELVCFDNLIEKIKTSNHLSKEQREPEKNFWMSFLKIYGFTN